MEDVTAKFQKRTTLLRATASRDWGWHKKSFRRVQQSAQRSVKNYAALGCKTWLSSTNMDKLNRAQNQALLSLTEQYRSTTLEALCLESRFSIYDNHFKKLIAASQQKAFCLPAKQQREESDNSSVNKRLKNQSWKSTTQQLLLNLHDELQEENIQQP